jgi:hypothetical protein
MTTAPLPHGSPGWAVQVLSPEVRLAGAAGLVVGAVLVALAAVVAGGPAAAGAAVGVGMVLAFFSFGALTVGAVASVSPAASLPVALLTYVLQVAAVGLVLVALRRSGALESAVDARWAAGGVIAATLVWLVAQTVAATRSRHPSYDRAADSAGVPAGGRPARSGDRPDRPEASAR